MTKISRYGLKEKQKDKFTKELWELFASFQSGKEAEGFLVHYLTPAEVIIFAKRWQALKRLVDKKSYSEIGRELKMSSTTLSRFSNRLRASPGFGEKVSRRM